MKIDNDKQIVLLNNLTKASSPGSGSDVGAGSQKVADTGDKVELSGWTDEVNRLKAQIKALPEVDEAKVADMKQAIGSGTYNADGKLVARSIIKSNLLDETL